VIIDPKSHVPIYKQIASQILEAIDAGIYRADEMLPSLRALAGEIRVNPNTVQRAYDELERAGFVYSKRGVGLFVAGGQTASARSAAERKVVKLLCTAIRAGHTAELPPDRIRMLFENALSQSLDQPGKPIKS
jgi:GntR family transcriptional regulator